MANRVVESIRRGLEEAIAYVEGTADLSLYSVHYPGDSRREGDSDEEGDDAGESFAGRTDVR